MKPRIYFVRESGKNVKVGEPAMVVPINVRSALHKEYKAAITSEVLWMCRNTGDFETRNTHYVAC